ncbi:hypothetical protein Q5P01_005058 [Channa striata]|uniref:Ensconsin n=1 Tax=Channa striata TaxID=64152 RepID=A0AA88NGU9_CHASR|nr:hypothetical protein Q5P01_005058 [Channa striata]
MAEQGGSDASPPESQAFSSQYKSEDGRASSATRPSSSGSGQTYTPTLTPTSTPTPTPTPSRPPPASAPLTMLPPKQVNSLLFNKIDERQRLARERREEKEKQNAVREAQWQAREERAKHHYEKHLEERKKKLEEQRIKEERRRVAVEEKRRQKQEEDKARHEAVMRRTLERSQKTRQKPNRWSWGGALHTNTPSTPADPDRRSMSTMNLSKHADPVITKRLSSSSATLLHSPDRGLRRLPLTPWESNVVNRLQQPTHSYLARSRSAVSLSGEQTAMPVCPRSVSCHPMGSMSFKTLQAQPLPHCRSQERSLSRETGLSSSNAPRRRTTGTTQQKDRDNVRKSWSNLSLPLAPILTLPPSKRSSSPGKRNIKFTAPSPGRPPQKPAGRPPTPKLHKSPGAEDPGNIRPVRVIPQSPRPQTPTKVQEEEKEQVLSPLQPRPQPLGQNKTSPEQTSPATTSESVSSPPAQRPSAGTTDPEEASRILAEKRRLAREQREREEEERRVQEEQARLAKEEMARRKAEERAKREEEIQRQLEEKRRREEEEERKAEEERLQKEREEAERLQRQKEEEDSRQREEAERLRTEREKHFQKEEAERLERKKRLEEIMKRTRRSDTAEKKVDPNKNGDSSGNHFLTPDPPAPSAVTVSPTHNSSSNNHQPDSSQNCSTAPLIQPDQRENGEFEEVIVLPTHSRLSPPEGEEEQQQQQEERAPIVAFRENGLLKPLNEERCAQMEVEKHKAVVLNQRKDPQPQTPTFSHSHDRQTVRPFSKNGVSKDLPKASPE